jgi:hypothetical protein
MVKKAMPMTAIPNDFVLTEKTISWVTEKFPTVNIEGTLEKFSDSALANGRMYADWQAAFRTWVRKAVDNKWDGVEFKQGRAQDPKWLPILNEVRPYGFRMPQPQETPDSYRTQFNFWKRDQERNKKPSPVIEFGNVLKRIP